jgi:hypothetical protein
MQHVIHSGGGPAGDLEIGQIAFDELDVRQMSEIVPVTGRKIVDNADPLASPYEFFGEMRTNETGPASY